MGAARLRETSRRKDKKKATNQDIDLNTKEWFDRVNGNSYFSAVVTLNYKMEDEKTMLLPFQYGYGSHSEHMAFKALIKASLP